MKKLVVLFFVLVVGISTSYGQYVRSDRDSTHPTQAKTSPKRFSIGGNFALQFGTITVAGISPLVYYKLVPGITIGVGPMYQYYSYSQPGYPSFSTSVYGARAVALYYLPDRLNNIFLMGEYDVLSIPYYDYFSNASARTTIGIPLGGVGYRMPVGLNSYFTVAGLWDFSHSQLSPYANPVLLFGFDLGL